MAKVESIESGRASQGQGGEERLAGSLHIGLGSEQLQLGGTHVGTQSQQGSRYAPLHRENGLPQRGIIRALHLEGQLAKEQGKSTLRLPNLLPDGQAFGLQPHTGGEELVYRKTGHLAFLHQLAGQLVGILHILDGIAQRTVLLVQSHQVII